MTMLASVTQVLLLQNGRGALAYLPMRNFALSLIFCLLLVDLAWPQTIDVTSPKAGAPMYRPVLLGAGPEALINRIDAKDLVRQGQKDAVVMFVCSVLTSGEIGWSGTYRGTPDSKLLEQELQKKLAPASDTKFIPAIYNHTPVDAIY